MPPSPSVLHRPDGTGTMHPGNRWHVRPKTSSSSEESSTFRVAPPAPITIQQASSSAHPDIRSSKHPRATSVVEAIAIEISPAHFRSHKAGTKSFTHHTFAPCLMYFVILTHLCFYLGFLSCLLYVLNPR